MAQVRETIEIQAAPERVWALAGDPGRIGEWLPALTGATLEGDRRTVTTADGGTIEERILERSEEGRYYVYEISRSPLPLASYRSRLAVHGHGGHAHVDWEASFEAESPELQPELTATFSQLYRDGLANLRQQLERSPSQPPAR